MHGHITTKEPYTVASANDSAPATPLVAGMIVDGNRGRYWVDTPDGVLLCTLRGRLRKQLLYARSPNLRHTVRRANVQARDPVAVGDRVRVLPLGGGKGIVEEIVARDSGTFTREDALIGQVTTVAGIDQLVAVLAAREPVPHLGLLDRVLVLAEVQQLHGVICLNKVDLGVGPALAARLEVYRALGYPVVLTSATSGAGLADLRQALAGRTSAFVGPSGAGKSSLLNALEPGLAQRVSAISQATGKGRHTTSGTRLVQLAGPEGGYLADTAGIRALALGGAAAGHLDWCFREFRPYLGRCFHADCRHRHEPGCAVQAAVTAGQLDRERYASYCRLDAEGAAEAGRAWKDLVSSRSLSADGEFRL
jgi:ribosome biogenesis GTPase